MGPVNSNNLMNVTMGGGDDLLSHDILSDHSLEAYTVVLSATAHILSTLFGGGSSVALLVAITTRTNINKYSYTLVLTLLLTCCCLNFVWSPLEVVDLILFHHTHKHPVDSYVAIKTYTYLFLNLLISFIIVLLSAEATLRMKHCFGTMLKRIWPFAACIFALLCSTFLIALFIAKCLLFIEGINFSYVIIHKDTRSLILIITAFAFCIVTFALLVLFVFITKETVYFENGRPHFRQKKMKLTVPEFLISQSNACADNDGGFEHSQSGTPSPSTPKLLSVGNPETVSMKGEDTSPISDLPSPIAKPMGNRLGINMAQVLGRRRHTICQISDSTTTTGTSADPVSKAKQYNYVRKFSVDISALQAQLQNPKICKEAPFQSEIDLAKKQSSEKSQVPKPLLPLSGKFKENEVKPENEKKLTENSGGSTNNPPPPVIMVSNDDAPASPVDGDIPNDTHGLSETFHGQTKCNSFAGNSVQKPTTLTLKESAEVSAPTFESAVSDPSEAESEVRKMARLTLLLCLTFLLNMMPLLVTEVLESKLRLHAFINISTCTLAVSSIQTIVYPHLIACCDDVVHRAVQKLKKRIKHVCSCRSELDVHSQVEDSSSTSQV